MATNTKPHDKSGLPRLAEELDGAHSGDGSSPKSQLDREIEALKQPAPEGKGYRKWRPLVDPISESQFSLRLPERLFTQSIQLSNLAVELARLALMRDATDQRSMEHYLKEAADLLNRAALEVAEHDGLREANTWAALTQRRKPPIPFERVCGVQAEGYMFKKSDGKKLWFPPFTSADTKGFKGALEKHWERLVVSEMSHPIRGEDGEVGPPPTREISLKSRLIQGEGSLEPAIKEMMGYYDNWTTLLKAAVEAVGIGKGSEWAERVYAQWFGTVVNTLTGRCMTDWPKEGIPYDLLYSFAQSRKAGNKTKGRNRTKEPSKRVPKQNGGK